MRTSRSQLDRLLDPVNTRVQLDTLYKAASAVGRMVRLELVDGPARRLARLGGSEPGVTASRRRRPAA